MQCIRTLLAAVFLATWILTGRIVPAQSSPEKVPPGEQQIARLIALLDADRFDVRERASRDLHQIGQPALAALEAARAQGSAEVRGRAKILIDSLTVDVWRRELAQFASLPDATLDIEHGMWLIARILDPQAKQADLTRRLDDLAARVRRRLGKGIDPATADPEKLVAALHHVLFVEERLTGNVADRYHPHNSSLVRVLQTKQGLPVLLSHLTIAVAGRLDAPLVGIPLAGTYIVKYDGARAPAGFAKDDIFLDPFTAGRVLRSGGQLEQAFPAQSPENVVPLTNRETLTRILRNLTPALAERKEHEKLEQAMELLQLLEAHEPAAGN